MNRAVVERALEALRQVGRKPEGAGGPVSLKVESIAPAAATATPPSGSRYEPVTEPPSLPAACGASPGPTRDRKPYARLKAGPCRYDWTPAYSGLRLRCVAHRSHGDSTTVFRQAFGGYDTLADMLKAGVLTGMALQDALRTQ